MCGGFWTLTPRPKCPVAGIGPAAERRAPL
jgi:hypothetical protein